MAGSTAHFFPWQPCAYGMQAEASSESLPGHLSAVHGTMASNVAAEQRSAWQSYPACIPPVCLGPSTLPLQPAGLVQYSHLSAAETRCLRSRKRPADMALEIQIAKHQRSTMPTAAFPHLTQATDFCHQSQPGTPPRHSCPSSLPNFPPTHQQLLPSCYHQADNDSNDQDFFSPHLTGQAPSVCCSVSCDAPASSATSGQCSPYQHILTPPQFLARPQSVASCSSMRTAHHIAHLPTPSHSYAPLHPHAQYTNQLQVCLQVCVPQTHLTLHQQHVDQLPHSFTFYPVAHSIPHAQILQTNGPCSSSCCSSSSSTSGTSLQATWCAPQPSPHHPSISSRYHAPAHCFSSYTHLPSFPHAQQLPAPAQCSARVVRLHPSVQNPILTHLAGIVPAPSWCSKTNNAAALIEANEFMVSVRLPGDVEYMRVGAGSNIHQLGVLGGVCAASICLAQSYYQRLVLVMPGLQLALYVLLATGPKSNIPNAEACALPNGSTGPYSREQAEAITGSVKAACISLAAKMIEPRTGHHKRLQWLLSRITSTSVTASEACALERRVLHHLDFRLGPYFDLPDSDC